MIAWLKRWLALWLHDLIQINDCIIEYKSTNGWLNIYQWLHDRIQTNDCMIEYESVIAWFNTNHGLHN